MSGRRESLQARLARRLEEAPEGHALAFVDGRGRFAWQSFGELHGRAARYAAALAEGGLGAGDVCVLVAPSDEGCATALLAALLAGARPVLVAPPVVRGLHSQLREVVAHVVGRTGARAVVLGAELAEVGAELAGRHPATRFHLGYGGLEEGDAAAFRPAFPAAGEVAALQLTSGTTGFPRLCVWRQEAVLAALDGMERSMGLGRSDVCVNWTPLYHDMGLVNNFLLALTTGMPLALVGAMDFIKRPSLWLTTLAATGATVTWSPNFGFAVAAQRVSDRELAGVRLDGVRAFWNAAERVHWKTLDAFHRRFAPYGVSRAALKTNFGCAENVGGATFSSLEGEAPVEWVERRGLYAEGVARPAAREGGDEVVPIVGVGRPNPGMEIEILGPGGAPLPDGRVGRVALRTPSAMSGYLGDEEETRQAFSGDLLLTGDVGYLRGDELFWVGRERERINLHGKKYDPSDFEEVVFAVPGLREGSFAAFGVDDPELGTQRLVLAVEVRDDAGRPHTSIAREIREGVARRMGVTVGEVLLLPQGTMTKTSSGKRRHRFYRDLYLAGELQPLTAAAIG